MSRVVVRWTVPIVAGVSFLVAGCASPPEAEQKAASAAVAAARAAGADKYAATAYQAMSDLAKKAESEMADKKYKEAKETYDRLKAAAEQAAKDAESGKAALKAEVEKLVGSMETAWADLAKQATAAAKKMKPDMKQAWETDGQAVTDALKAAKDAVAASPAEAKEKLAAATAAVEKWTKDLTALATAPAPAAKAPAAKAPAAKAPAAKAPAAKASAAKPGAPAKKTTP